jgi:hypothetical protein
MMKTTLILSHVTTSHRRRRRVRVRMRQPVPIRHRPRRLRRYQHLLNPLQYINHTLTLTPLRLTIVLVVPSVDAHRKSRRHLNLSITKIFSAQIFFQPQCYNRTMCAQGIRAPRAERFFPPGRRGELEREILRERR